VRFAACTLVGATLLLVAASPARARPGPPVAPLPATVLLSLPLHPTRADLDRVSGMVTALTVRAGRQAALVDSASRALFVGELQVRAAAAQQQLAQGALSQAVRRSYIDDGGGDRLLGYLAGVAPSDRATLEVTRSRGLGVDSAVLRAARQAERGARSLAAAVVGERARLVVRAGPAEVLLGQAQQLLDSARAAFALDQAAESARVALAVLAARQAELAAASSHLAYAVTPAVTARGAGAAEAEAPVLRQLEQTPFGAAPAGYVATGDVIRGDASWYGPGFVGNPTSTGTPYDPQQLTCAMLLLPLGTVVRVTSVRTGRAVTLLVNDHGPYVVGRVIDLSQRAAQLLGVSLGAVTVEPLQRSRP
jgi:hypothetical protein